MSRTLQDYAYIHQINDRITELAIMAEPEDWGYRHSVETHRHEF